MGRRFLRAALFAVLLASAPAIATAHPLGNFTINHYAGIEVAQDAVHLDLVIDMAEIPTFQERQKIDTDGDGDVTDAETAAAEMPACTTQAALLHLSIGGTPASLTPASANISFPPGLGGLSTMRTECSFLIPFATPLTTRTTILFEDVSYPERIGWREIVVTGDGVTIDSGGLPTSSPSQRLTSYPAELIAQPLDIRSATVVATPGVAGPSPSHARPAGAGDIAAVPGGIGGELPAIFRQVDLTPIVLLVSMLTAFALGAGHALTPGHGKTIMAAYLVGSRGTPVHAVGLGLSVTVSHTLGILALAALVVGFQGALPPDVVVRGLPVVAAVTIVVIGGWMLVTELRRRGAASRRVAISHAGDHAHGHEGEHEHAHEHPDEHEESHADRGEEHEHGHGSGRHTHLPPAGSTLSWRGLFALGLAGGLIPSTSALFILLGSIVAGRPAFGFVLVVIFGLGMAAVMTGVGLAMVLARDRLERLPRRSSGGRLVRHAPLVAAVVVFGVGVYLTVQAVAGRPVL
jgi:nickel/cobalt exporter